MAHTRLKWKTIMLTSYDDYRALQSAWPSAKEALGAHKTVAFTKGTGMLTVETDLSVAHIRRLAQFAGVSIPWRNGVIYDSNPSWDEPSPDA